MAVDLASRMNDMADAVRQRWGDNPRAGVILGTGLGGLAEQIDAAVAIDYAEIPHLPAATALGHRGRLIAGNLGAVPIVAFQGRFHLYEGNTPQEAALPVRLLQALGAKTLILSNAAGGLNPAFSVGDVMLIDDHMNLMFANPLVGANDDQLGPRFPDMSAPYDCPLQQRALELAREANLCLQRGVYAGVIGPNYETRAEMRMLRRLGADAVGMSTVPETIAARHAGLRVVGFSAITNMNLPDSLDAASGHAVIASAARTAEALGSLVRGVAASL